MHRRPNRTGSEGEEILKKLDEGESDFLAFLLLKGILGELMVGGGFGCLAGALDDIRVSRNPPPYRQAMWWS